FFAYKPKTYVFSGKIDELQEYEHINSDVAYFRSHPLVPLTADDPPLRNEEFVVVSSTPFKKGDCVHFFFKKDQANRNGLDLLYDPAFKAQEFKIDLDQKSGKLEL